MRLFHPLGFMLASPAESAEQALSYFQNALVEDKYDGIRAQAHCSDGEVRIFSRTRDEITESFPELPDALAGLPEDAILDGEIVAWSYASPIEVRRRPAGCPAGVPPAARKQAEAALNRPGAPLQRAAATPGTKASQRKTDARRCRWRIWSSMFSMPAASCCWSALCASGRKFSMPCWRRQGNLELRDDSPGARRVLNSATTPSASNTRVIRAPVFQASTPQELDQLFEAAQARGNEGLMIKDPESPYTPGRRGKSWLKLKRELATLDVVVTAVEYGHGKRIGVLSDYTFAVRDGEKLVNIGKAYSGLTDVEIAEMTKWFLEHTVEDQGFRLIVEPKIVLEVAFNNMMRSDRHESGYALRFPRIVRLRPDKLPEEADTIERAREIYEKQDGNKRLPNCRILEMTNLKPKPFKTLNQATAIPV